MEGSAGEEDRRSGPVAAWPRWWFTWYGALLLCMTLSLAGYAAGSSPPAALLSSLAAVLYAPLLGIFAGPMLVLATLLRTAALRVAPRTGAAGLAVAVTCGAIAAGLGLFLVLALGDPRRMLQPAALPLDALVVPPLLASGGAAGALAHLEATPREARWWAITVGAVLVGLLGWVPLDPAFPRPS